MGSNRLDAQYNEPTELGDFTKFRVGSSTSPPGGEEEEEIFTATSRSGGEVPRVFKVKEVPLNTPVVYSAERTATVCKYCEAGCLIVSWDYYQLAAWATISVQVPLAE